MADDKYNLFDTLESGEIKLKFFDFTLRKREVALIFAVVLLGLCCTVMVIFVSVHFTAPSPFCESADCLSVAARMARNMNKTLDPCKDFYTYACKGWTSNQRNQIRPNQHEVTVWTGIKARNNNKLYRLLYMSGSKTGTDAEQKIKQFYRSCIDNYSRMKASGAVFIEKVLKPMGGWNVLNNQKPDWDFNQAMKVVHVDLWTVALFNFYVYPDPHRPTKGVIEIDIGGLGMYWRYYLRPDTKRVRDSYKRFMRNVATFLVRDANRTMDDATKHRVDVFIEDVMKIETALANVTSQTLPSDNPHDQDNRIRLSELKRRAPAIDWVGVMTYMFDDAHVSENTKVVLMEHDYVVKMSAMIQSLGNDKNRILNNYFVWRLAQEYVQHLSWEYVHANREFYVERTGRKQFLGTWRHCFRVVSYYMPEALSALFVRDHFVDNSKPKVHEILRYIKKALVERLDDLTWMDAPTKRLAIEKVRAIVDKVGYPDHLMNNRELDRIYSKFNVVRGDYLLTVLNAAKFEKDYWNRMLLEGESKDDWRVQSYSMAMHYYQWWNEIIIPAGVLQQPAFWRKYPGYVNFATIGHLMGHSLVHAVDEFGGFYRKNGMMDDWWSNRTSTKYEARFQCMSDYYSTMNAGPYNLPGWGARVPVPVNGDRYARDGMAETGAVRLAYYAYHSWMNENGNEKLPPTIGLTTDQAFFTSYAQLHCYQRRDIYDFFKTSSGTPPENIRVNGALSQLPEFARAFSCPKKSPMNAAKKCDVF